MATHAFARMGAGGTTALATTQIGADISMPAGGPWIIHGLWGLVVKQTTIPDQGTGGALIIQAKSGDLSPDPAPGTYPLMGNSSSNAANANQSCLPLQLYPVNWEASGKAVISLSYLNQLATTTGSMVACGIIFGDTIPEVRPLVFCDGVRAATALATEIAVGTITLAEKATRIVGIWADINVGEAWTAAEHIIGTIRLASDDIKMPPAQYPCVRGYDACDGTMVGTCSSPFSQFIPVDIPVEGGARINCYATSQDAVTNNVEFQIYIAYE